MVSCDDVSEDNAKMAREYQKRLIAMEKSGVVAGPSEKTFEETYNLTLNLPLPYEVDGQRGEVITPNGTQQRYRPSDKPTLEEKRAEGGIIEQKVNGKWVPLDGANTNLNNPYDHRNGPGK